MKRLLLLGGVLALLFVTTLSCNKNRFDFSELNSAEGSGEWKLPIASVNVTLSRLMSQLNDNEFIDIDPNGNIKLKFDFEQDPVVSMRDVMRFQNTEVPFTFSFDNPYQSEPVYIDTTILFSHVVELGADSAHLESLKLRTGTLLFHIESNLGQIDSIIVTSPNISFPNGDTLNALIDVLGSATMDLTGAIVHLDSYALNFNFKIHYWLSGIDAEEYYVNTDVGIRDLDIEYLSGYIDSYDFPIEFDSLFNLDLGNVQGALSLLDASIQIQQKNTCENLNALVTIDTLMFYGGNLPPAMVFEHPVELDVTSGTAGYVDAFNQTFNIRMSTQQTGVHLAGTAVANPGGLTNLVTISDTSSISLKVNAAWPFKFNVDAVTYVDTLDLSVSSFTAPELINEVRLLIDFESRLPFSIGAQLFAYNSGTGKMTEIMSNGHVLSGAYGNNSEKSETIVAVNHENLGDFLASDKLIMKLGITTDGHDVQLNVNTNALGMVVKAEVEYGGAVDF
ncbi:MAG: hypothetical protein J6W26_08015 [Bacteroidales bacterium]|nr:hypothetical protein [Bacteroidales bacterium]